MKKFLVLSIFVIFFTNSLLSQTILNESFDGSTFVPAGWYKAKINNTNFPASGQWERVVAGSNPLVNSHSGAAMARFDSPSAGFNTISELGTPVLNLSSGAAYRLRFWLYRGDNAALQSDLLDVYVNTQPNITGGNKLQSFFISRIKTPTETANGWYEYVLDIPAVFNTANNYIIFRATGNSSNAVYVDDVIVEAFTCHKPLNTTVTNILTTSATLNWNPAAAGSSTGYEWELRTDGSAGTGALGLAASGSTAMGQTIANATGLVQGSDYNFFVRSSCGTEKSTWTNPVFFNTPCNPFTIPYTENFDGISTGVPPCTITENLNGGNTWASAVNVWGSAYANSAPNAITCTVGGNGATGGQNDWFYTAPLSLEAGKCYQLSFACRTHYYAFIQALRIKIGTAQNEAAMTVAELFNSNTIANDSYTTTTVNFSVATTGVYFIGFNHYGTNGNGPIFIDDIKVAESVGVPVAIAANPIGATTAQLNWMPAACGTPSAYEWELRTTGTAGSGSGGLITAGSGSGVSTLFTALGENKSYRFFIRAKSGSLTGAWSNAYVFLTACSIRSLPYTENFDGVVAPALPACIIKQDLNTVYNPWNTWSNEGYNGPYSAPNCMRVGTDNSNFIGNNWFFTPPFSFVAGKSYRLHFAYRNTIYTSNEKLEVKYGTDANAAAMTSSAIFSNSDIRNAIYKKAVVDFTPTQNGTYNIGFHYFSDAPKNFIYVDDIKIEETPACDVVRDISATKLTATTAFVNWLAALTGTADGYNWELRTTGTAGSGAAGLVNSGSLIAGTLSVGLSGLTSGSSYSFYIKSNCNTENSQWVPYTFVTPCNAVYAPYNENFDGVATPAVPACTRVEELFDQYKWSTATGIARSAPNSLYHPYTFQSPFDDWFFTAPLQLTATRTYKLTFYYRQQAAGNTDAVEIKLGNYAQGDSMTAAPIYTNTAVSNTAYQQATVTFTIPASGVYYMGIHSIIGNYSRGVAIDDISINEMTPDLFITNGGLSTATAAKSETITANFTINNQGLTTAVAHKTYFYLSADEMLTPGANGDTLIGVYNYATPLNAADNTGNLTKTLNIPCALQPGNYTLFYVADGAEEIIEINETNNVVGVPLTITAGTQWNGLVNTNWENAGNWSCNQVPGPASNVVINSGTVVVNTNISIRSLTIKPGVNFTVAPGATVTVLH